ncbi:hypothetical protein [Methyloglobulus sp.]|uniref:hypothetical protein n=1 Tax=Methyloglobulus sp. TaxID=2518622 RepID=UPI00398905F3
MVGNISIAIHGFWIPEILAEMTRYVDTYASQGREIFEFLEVSPLAGGVPCHFNI